MDSLTLTVVLLCVVVPAFIVLVGWSIIDNQKKKEKRVKAAATQYENALELLKESPDDNDARQEALRLGRRFVKVAQDDKHTLFDEVALMNDLSAIQQTSTKPTELESSNIEQRLLKLDELKSKGLITEDDYQKRKDAILDEI